MNRTENYAVSVNAETKLTIDSDFYSENSGVGQPVTILVNVIQGSGPHRNADVKVTVQAPTMSLDKWGFKKGDTAPLTELRNVATDKTFILYDDGNHGDGNAGDGLYGNFYLDTQITGSYVFRTEVSGITQSGHPFTRITENSTFIETASGMTNIAGTITYKGSHSGNVYVRAWQNDRYQRGVPDYVSLATHSLTFALKGLVNASYSISAFMDLDEDGGYDPDEPYGSVDTLVTVSERTSAKKIELSLRDASLMPIAFPNPFNPHLEIALIRYRLTNEGEVTIKIYDSLSTLVRTLAEKKIQRAGMDQFSEWDGRNGKGNLVANGVYFYVVESSSGENAVGKIAVIK